MAQRVVGHFLGMGAAAFLLHLAMGRRTLRGSLSAAGLIIGLAATAEEAAHLLSPVRSFDWLDLLANLAGVWAWL